jgi:hypothetical protein
MIDEIRDWQREERISVTTTVVPGVARDPSWPWIRSFAALGKTEGGAVTFRIADHDFFARIVSLRRDRG